MVKRAYVTGLKYDGQECFHEDALIVDLAAAYGDKLIFIRRRNEPYKNEPRCLAVFRICEIARPVMPGDAREEIGCIAEILKLVGVYSNPHRDPRGPVVSICYLLRAGRTYKASTDASEVILLKLNEIPKLAFDHNTMIGDAEKECNLYGILSQM